MGVKLTLPTSKQRAFDLIPVKTLDGQKFSGSAGLEWLPC